MTDEKELKSIHNFYKDSEHGFSTRDGYYAVPVLGSETKLMIIHEGGQLKTCRNEESARNFITKHRKQSKKGTVFVK
tara:strand:- start:790 stop:1020 length:231 start_codon:yes stop_codon:yes gene_type:complete